MRVSAIVLATAPLLALSSCDERLRVDTAHAELGTDKRLSIIVAGKSDDLSGFSFGGYIHLIACDGTGEERFLPVEKISMNVIEAKLTSGDTAWLLSDQRPKEMCASLFDRSRIGRSVSSNTIPIMGM